MGSHAVLSPSGAHRWLACTPSARLEQQFEDKAGTAADEGTLAHAVGEILINRKLGRMSERKYSELMDSARANPLYEKSILDYAEDYSVFVIERYNEAKAHTPDAQIYIEQRIDLTYYIPEGFGTADVVIVANKLLDFIDFKFGKGVFVDVNENEQVMTYAIGIVDAFAHIFDFERVRMTIYQPRMDNIAVFEMTVEDLLKWGNDILRPKAALAFAGEGDFVAGGHCQFCKARPECKALADYNMEMAKYDFADPELMDDYDIVDVLNRKKMFLDWIKAVHDNALSKAVAGKSYPGYKVVAGKSNRRYADTKAILEVLEELEYNIEEVAPRKILNITKLTKVMGKTDFNMFLSPYIIKPQGKPTLAPESDKREMYDKSKSAAEDFEDDPEED